MATCTYLAVFLVYLNTVIADLSIHPPEAIVTPGSNFNITCNCSSDCLASDISWMKNFQPLSENIIVNEPISQLLLHDLQFDDSATFTCCLKDNPFCYETSMSLKVGTPPGPVQNFHCTSRNIVDYWCEWQEGNSTNLRMSYDFKYKSVNKDDWSDCPDTKGDNTCYISSSHNPGSHQDMKVISTNAMGDHTTWIRFNPDDETVPNPPTEVTAHATDHRNIGIKWEIPDEWNETWLPNSLVYKIRYSPKGKSDWKEKLTDRYTTNTILTDLEPFTEYTMEVAAKVYYINEELWSLWSEAIYATTNETAPTGYVLPSIEEEKKVPPYSRNVKLFWNTMSDDDANGIILGYRLFVHKIGDSSLSIEESTTNEKTLYDLDRYSDYEVLTQAYNSAGYGPNSTFMDIQDRTERPGNPIDIRSTAISKSSIMMEWKPPSEPNGYLQNYTIGWKISSADEWSRDTVRESETSHEITELQAYTLYDTRIRANNHKFEGLWVASDQPTRTLQGAPTKAPEPISLQEVLGNPNELKISWTPLQESDKNGVIQGYEISYCRSNQQQNCDGDISMRVVNGSSTYSFVHNLDPFTQYLAWVAAFTSAGTGPASDRKPGTTGQGIPTPPLNLVITNTTSFSVGLSWDPPVEANGIVEHYTVRYSRNQMPAPQDKNENTIRVEGLDVVVSGLLGDTIYLFDVQACNTGNLCGGFSNPVLDTTEIGAPGPPALRDMSPVSSSRMSLSWDAPLQPNGPIQYYYVEHRRSNSEGWTKVKVKTTQANVSVDCNVGDDGIMFDFRVSAVTIAEDGLILQGEATPRQQYEMCSPVPVFVVVPAVVIPLCIISVAILVAYVVYRLRKSTVPDPFIKKDPRMDKEWHGTFFVREEEIFDNPSQLLCTNSSTIQTSSNMHQVAADFDILQSTSIHVQQNDGEGIMITETFTIPGNRKATFSNSESTDSGVPGTPPLSNDSSSMFPSDQGGNDVFQGKTVTTNDDASMDSTAVIDIHSIFKSDKVDLFETISPYMKVGQKQGNLLGGSNRANPFFATDSIPMNTLSNTDDPYAKMSQLPLATMPNSSTPQQNHANVAPHAVLTQSLIDSTLSNTASANLPRYPINTDSYSKMSQIPVVDNASTQPCEKRNTTNSNNSSNQNITMSSKSKTDPDPYSKMSQIPPIQQCSIPKQGATIRILPQPSIDTASYSKMSEIPKEPNHNANMTHSVNGVDCRPHQPSQGTIAQNSLDTGPYSKMSQLPAFQTSSPTATENSSTFSDLSRSTNGRVSCRKMSEVPSISENICRPPRDGIHMREKNNQQAQNQSFRTPRAEMSQTESDRYSQMSQLPPFQTGNKVVKEMMSNLPNSSQQHIVNELPTPTCQPLASASIIPLDPYSKVSQLPPIVVKEKETQPQRQSDDKANRFVDQYTRAPQLPEPTTRISVQTTENTDSSLKQQADFLPEPHEIAFTLDTYSKLDQLPPISTQNSDDRSVPVRTDAQQYQTKPNTAPLMTTIDENRNPPHDSDTLRNQDPYFQIGNLSNAQQGKMATSVSSPAGTTTENFQTPASQTPGSVADPYVQYTKTDQVNAECLNKNNQTISTLQLPKTQIRGYVTRDPHESSKPVGDISYESSPTPSRRDKIPNKTAATMSLLPTTNDYSHFTGDTNESPLSQPQSMGNLQSASAASFPCKAHQPLDLQKSLQPNLSSHQISNNHGNNHTSHVPGPMNNADIISLTPTDINDYSKMSSNSDCALSQPMETLQQRTSQQAPFNNTVNGNTSRNQTVIDNYSQMAVSADQIPRQPILAAHHNATAAQQASIPSTPSRSDASNLANDSAPGAINDYSQMAVSVESIGMNNSTQQSTPGQTDNSNTRNPTILLNIDSDNSASALPISDYTKITNTGSSATLSEQPEQLVDSLLTPGYQSANQSNSSGNLQDQGQDSSSSDNRNRMSSLDIVSDYSQMASSDDRGDNEHDEGMGHLANNTLPISGYSQIGTGIANVSSDQNNQTQNIDDYAQMANNVPLAEPTAVAGYSTNRNSPNSASRAVHSCDNAQVENNNSLPSINVDLNSHETRNAHVPFTSVDSTPKQLLVSPSTADGTDLMPDMAKYLGQSLLNQDPTVPKMPSSASTCDRNLHDDADANVADAENECIRAKTTDYASDDSHSTDNTRTHNSGSDYQIVDIDIMGDAGLKNKQSDTNNNSVITDTNGPVQSLPSPKLPSGYISSGNTSDFDDDDDDNDDPYTKLDGHLP